MEISDEVVTWAIDQTRGWIQGQREAHRPAAGAIPDGTKDRLRPFFTAAALDSARLRDVPAIPNPPFLEQARTMGVPVTIDFGRMAGLTVVDTILLSQSVPANDPLRLVFHELVHLVQYQVLGLDEFARRYVRGIVDGGFDYYRIPLEIQAYELDARFAANPSVAFSVLEQVSR